MKHKNYCNANHPCTVELVSTQVTWISDWWNMVKPHQHLKSWTVNELDIWKKKSNSLSSPVLWFHLSLSIDFFQSTWQWTQPSQVHCQMSAFSCWHVKIPSSTWEFQFFNCKSGKRTEWKWPDCYCQIGILTKWKLPDCYLTVYCRIVVLLILHPLLPKSVAQISVLSPPTHASQVLVWPRALHRPKNDRQSSCFHWAPDTTEGTPGNFAVAKWPKIHQK